MTSEGNTSAAGATVVAIVSDLIFSAKIASTAGSLGVATRIARDPHTAGQAVDEQTRLVLVDLDQDNVDPETLVATLRNEPNGISSSCTIVGFVSHVRADRIAEAREHGFDKVMARSAFVDRLPEMLSGTART